jgi:hypothetical protein
MSRGGNPPASWFDVNVDADMGVSLLITEAGITANLDPGSRALARTPPPDGRVLAFLTPLTPPSDTDSTPQPWTYRFESATDLPFRDVWTKMTVAHVNIILDLIFNALIDKLRKRNSAPSIPTHLTLISPTSVETPPSDHPLCALLWDLSVLDPLRCTHAETVKAEGTYVRHVFTVKHLQPPPTAATKAHARVRGQIAAAAARAGYNIDAVGSLLRHIGV